jgi:ethanolamine ammonia-lyase small subunit
MLEFQLAHAAARDAVHAALPEGFGAEVAGRPTVAVHSRAPDRATYLLRPDLGRRLATESRAALHGASGEVAVVIADGLSATGITAHGIALAESIVRHLPGRDFAPVTIARQARVALGDDIGEALGAAIVIVLIGERPGLSAADGIGAYLTLHPRLGRRDAERNCVSNIRPGGLTLDRAAELVAKLTEAAFALGQTGVKLKPPSARAIDVEDSGSELSCPDRSQA